jgi:hypothetical protein
MRARSPIALPLMALVAAFACGPVGQPPPPLEPINACPQFPCAAYSHTTPPPTCNGDACISNGQLDPILVINMAEGSFYAPTAELAITYSDLVKDRYHARSDQTPDCRTPSCAVLPNIWLTSGVYLVGGQVQQDVGLTISAGSQGATVPSHVMLRPMWPPVVAPKLKEAQLSGVLLEPLSARVTTVSLPPGPFATPGRGWTASLMPGVYERTISPDPPYDAFFPPLVSVVSVAGDTNDVAPITNVDDSVDLDKLRGVRIVRQPDDSLEGWTVYLLDVLTGRRLSEIVTLHGKGGPAFHLNTIGYGALRAKLAFNTRVVVAPPKGTVGLPTYANNVIDEHFAGDPPESDPLKYPALPAPVIVSGTVQSPTGQPIDADLFIEEQSSESGSLVTAVPNDPARPFLHYKTTAQTSDGHYEVILPPGMFSVYVVPSRASELSATEVKLDVGGPPAPTTQAGKNLVVYARTTLSGSCIVDDGRPLAGAEVEATAAVELVGAVEPARWPRPQRTTTDADGTFSLSLDQGTYDVVVRPSEASRLPWTISTSHLIGAEAVHLEPLRIPAPVGFDLTLRSPGNSPIAQAVVRAYAFPMRQNGQNGTGPVAIEIGHWLTGVDGRFRMFVTQPQ